MVLVLKMYTNLAISLIALFTTLAFVESFSCTTRYISTQIKPFFNIIVFVPLPDKDYDPAFDQGYSIIPAVELAVDQINRRTDILPHSDLIVNVKDSGCDKASKTAVETVSVIRDLYMITRSAPVAIIGPACSEDSIFIANTFYNTVTLDLPVFYSGTTPYLSEHAEEIPNAFGMISSADVLTDTLIKIAQEKNWNWENIAVLYDEPRKRFVQVYDAFVKNFDRGFNNSQQVGYTRQIADSQIPLGEVIERNIRIVVVFSGKKPARQLACLAGLSTVNYIFPVRQFIFTEKSMEDFIGDEEAEPSFIEQSEGKQYYCDKETVIRGLNGSILINQELNSVDPDVVTVSNYTAGQVKQQYKERLKNCGKAMNPSTTLSESSYAYPYYDAMWALAHGLHIAFQRPGFSFRALYDDIENNVSFQGVSSWIDFNDNNHVSNPVNLMQINGPVAVLVGTRDNESNLAFDANTLISDNFTTMQNVLHPALTVLGFVSSSLSFLLTVILQFMNTYFHKYPSVKASSPRLNHFIFIGCYSLVFAIFITTLRHTIPELIGIVLCNLDVVCIILGYCFIFATIFAKSWRTYRIFNHPFESHKFLRDSTLSILIGTSVIIQFLLIIPFLVVSPFLDTVASNIDSSLWPPIKKFTTTCVTQSIGYITIPLIFQLLLTIATVFLATLNRKIRRSNFRTTKQIIMLVYILAIIWLLGGSLLIIFYLVHYSENITYLIYAGLLASTVILSQIILIVPALALAINAKWNLSQRAKSRRQSWLRRSFSHASKTGSTYM